MLYRTVAAFVVIFWLTMTALLLRNEVRPGDSALREVPLGHVVKLLFHHQQVSDLNIVSDKLRLGRLRLVPQSDRTTDRRTIAFDGNLHFAVPGGKRQRVAWRGELEMDKALDTQRFRLATTAHEPMEIHSEVVVLPKENVARYEIRAGARLERQEFSLDERGAREVLQQLGIDPELLPAGPLVRVAPPIVKAQQSSMEIHGERIDTYRVTVEANGQTWLECHVSQLGQILRATTLLGYTLTPDDITP